MVARKKNKHRSVEVDPTHLCIILCPIGKPGSDVRSKAELLTREIQKAAQSCGLSAKRVDELTEGEEITPAMIRLITTARMAVADLDGGNSNVHYELGVRHAHGLPALCLMPQRMKGDQERPGFDIKDISPIYYPPFDPKAGWGGKAKGLRNKISDALKKLTAKGTAPAYFLEELQRVCAQRTMKLILKSKMSSLDRFSDGLDRFHEDYKSDFETRHGLTPKSALSLRKLVKYPAREMYGFTKAYKSMAAAEQTVEKDRQQTILKLCSRMNQMAESAAGMAQILQEASSLQEGDKSLLRSLTKQLKTRLAQTRTHLRACQTLAASA